MQRIPTNLFPAEKQCRTRPAASDPPHFQNRHWPRFCRVATNRKETDRYVRHYHYRCRSCRISAGIYAVSRGQRTLVLEKAQVGGIIGKVSTVTHYTAIIQSQETGATFAARMKEQALNAGVEIIQATVTGVTRPETSRP